MKVYLYFSFRHISLLSVGLGTSCLCEIRKAFIERKSKHNRRTDIIASYAVPGTIAQFDLGQTKEPRSD